MPNIVVIAKDDKLRMDLDKICSEMASEEVRIASFTSSSEFEELYFKKAPPKTPPDQIDSSENVEEPSEEGAELQLFGKIHLILMAEDALTARVKDTAINYLTLTKKKNLWPEGKRTRIIAMRFEEDVIDKLSFTHPALDDLIFLPLDRPLLLQKLEIFLGLPKVSKPSYLYYQNTSADIEISKIVTLEKLNDCALVIRNKSNLKIGMAGKFYVTPPGTKEPMSFVGKVFRTEPHPEYPGEFLVYFFFFGITKNETLALRQWLSSSSEYQNLIMENPADFFVNSEDMFLTENDKTPFPMAIVDHDIDHSNQLKELLMRRMDRLNIFSFPSFSLFFEFGLAREANQVPFSPSPSDSSHLPPSGLKIICRAEDKKIVSLEPTPQEDLLFCGHPLSTLFDVDQNSWWDLFSGFKPNEILFNDAAAAPTGVLSTSLLFAKSIEDLWIGFEVEFILNEEGHLSLNFLPISTDQLAMRLSANKKIPKLSALIMDTKFVSPNFEAWTTALAEQAQRAGAIAKPDDLKIILVGDPMQMDEAWLKSDHVITFLAKPADPKLITTVLSETLKNPNTAFKVENLGWIRPKIKTHLAKAVKLSQLGEFGATINTSTPFREGSFFYLRKGIFNQAPNGCLAARVYHTEENPSEDGRYLSHVTYFGINDFFLKHARNYMREQYTASKSKE